MDHITSRKNAYIMHLRSLASDSAYRRSCGEFICDGMKLLEEAIAYGAEICSVLWKGEKKDDRSYDCPEYSVPADLFDYACPQKNSPGPVFTVRIPQVKESIPMDHVIVLENVQDPGNVGTVIRSANAFFMDAVILTGACADLYSPKTVRATMGAIFRQRVFCKTATEVQSFCKEHHLPLYGAALSSQARDIRGVQKDRAAIAVGSEGRGLSAEFLSMCDGQLIIPMNPDSESLNAAIAASVIMWEMVRGR